MHCVINAKTLGSDNDSDWDLIALMTFRHCNRLPARIWPKVIYSVGENVGGHCEIEASTAFGACWVLSTKVCRLVYIPVVWNVHAERKLFLSSVWIQPPTTTS